MIKNMNNGTIKNDHKNKQSCNDWIIYGNKTRIPKRAVYIRIQLNKRSPKLVLDAILLQRILVLEQFVSASKLAPKVLSADKVNS